MPPHFLLESQLLVQLLLQLELRRQVLNRQVLEHLHDEVLQPLEQLRFRELVP
jgi:hypothetical protein